MRHKAFAIILLYLLALVLTSGCADPREKEYEAAMGYTRLSRWVEAAEKFEALDDYKDSADQAREARFRQAWALEDEGEHEQAISLFLSIRDWDLSVAPTRRILNDFAKRITGDDAMQNAAEFLDLLDFALDQGADLGVILQDTVGTLYDLMIKLSNYNYDTDRTPDYEQIEELSNRIRAVDHEAFQSNGTVQATLRISGEKLAYHNEQMEAIRKYEEEMAPYNYAFEAAQAGDFDEARIRFEALAENSERGKDKRGYIALLDAMQQYEAGDWIAALDTLDQYYDAGYAVYDDFYEAMTIWYKTLKRPDLASPNLVRAYSGPTTRFQYPSHYDIRAGLYNDCLNYYMQQQFGTDQSLQKIYDQDATVKYKPRDQWLWFRLQSDSLVDKTLLDQELYTYYRKTDNTPSPIRVTGDKWFVLQSMYDDTFYDPIPAYYLADELEQIRYLLYFTQIQVPAITYQGGIKGYAATTIVMLKDVLTGEILFQESYSNVPPQVVRFQAGETPKDVYADFSYDKEALNTALAPFLPIYEKK